MLGALVFAAVAVASTQSNTASYISTVKYKGKATKKKPKNVVYNGVLHLSTTDEKQPNTSSPTELFIARQLKFNGAKLKTCKQSDFDTLPNIPAKCNKAIVGDGTAGALAGKPGADPQAGEALAVPLDVKVINGPKGKTLFLAVYGGAATGNGWRAIPGKIKKLKKGPFGARIQFKVPPELQSPAPGSQVALTDFNVKIKTKRTAKIKGKRASYVQITKCPKSHKLPTKAVVHFHNDDNSPGGGNKTSRKTMTCH